MKTVLKLLKGISPTWAIKHLVKNYMSSDKIQFEAAK